MRLLIVEDEAKIAASLEKGLTAEGYVIDVAEDSDAAETLADANNYDLILMDWMIPGHCDGPTLVDTWRKEGVQTPILMLTAKTTIGDKVRGLDAGADDYLPKPFSFDELLARVRALLRRPKENKGNIFTTGPLTLDIVSKEATVQGSPVHLTAKEFQMLEYLIRHKGEVISKDQLLDHVWADDSRVQHNTVETFVANIRKKIGDEVIMTMRGHGYKVK
ncbi:MAG TPA: response regulator transcription factor [Patescibacteria group bacterium]|nr:response regulator transcription factor [Patescibacteria group bacterium]